MVSTVSVSMVMMDWCVKETLMSVHLSHVKMVAVVQ